jgi:hypothetical protein
LFFCRVLFSLVESHTRDTTFPHWFIWLLRCLQRLHPHPISKVFLLVTLQQMYVPFILSFFSFSHIVSLFGLILWFIDLFMFCASVFVGEYWQDTLTSSLLVCDTYIYISFVLFHFISFCSFVYKVRVL